MAQAPRAAPRNLRRSTARLFADSRDVPFMTFLQVFEMRVSLLLSVTVRLVQPFYDKFAESVADDHSGGMIALKRLEGKQRRARSF